jgi:cobalamin biosynthesis Mg chelatase CobN
VTTPSPDGSPAPTAAPVQASATPAAATTTGSLDAATWAPQLVAIGLVVVLFAVILWSVVYIRR